jgi:hypothetical protein
VRLVAGSYTVRITDGERAELLGEAAGEKKVD